MHNLFHALVVGGVLLASSLVKRGDGGSVETDGGHRDAALLGQVGQVGGD